MFGEPQPDRTPDGAEDFRAPNLLDRAADSLGDIIAQSSVDAHVMGGVVDAEDIKHETRRIFRELFSSLGYELRSRSRLMGDAGLYYPSDRRTERGLAIDTVGTALQEISEGE